MEVWCYAKNMYWLSDIDKHVWQLAPLCENFVSLFKRVVIKSTNKESEKIKIYTKIYVDHIDNVLANFREISLLFEKNIK